MRTCRSCASTELETPFPPRWSRPAWCCDCLAERTLTARAAEWRVLGPQLRARGIQTASPQWDIETWLLR